MGVPEIRAVRCNTSYASLDIPLKEIDHITIEDDHERATIAMRNGDRLSVVLNIGEWHQVVGTYDGKHLALYVDGKLTREGKKEIGPVTVDWTNAAHCLGKRAERVGQTWYWKGKMDEVMIFSRVLTPQEVGNLHIEKHTFVLPRIGRCVNMRQHPIDDY